MLQPLRPGFPLSTLKEGCRVAIRLAFSELFRPRLVRRSGFPLYLVEERKVTARVLTFAVLPAARIHDFFGVPTLMFKTRLSALHVPLRIVAFAHPSFGCS